MIKDQEFLHGAAFLRLIDYGESVTIQHLSNIHPSLYQVESNTTKSVILFKLSTKPTSAWSFSFSEREDSILKCLHEKFPHLSVFFALICHKDGVWCIAEDRLWEVINQTTGLGGQRISVSRQPHGRYHINGPSRQRMDQTIPQNDWPRVVFVTKAP